MMWLMDKIRKRTWAHTHTQSNTHSHVRAVWVWPAPDAGYGVSEPSSCGSWRCILLHGSLVSNGRVSPHIHTHSTKIWRGWVEGEDGADSWWEATLWTQDPSVVAYRWACSSSLLFTSNQRTREFKRWRSEERSTVLFSCFCFGFCYSFTQYPLKHSGHATYGFKSSNFFIFFHYSD